MFDRNRNEINAVLTIVRRFEGLYYIGIHVDHAALVHPSIEYELKINHAGRKLLRGSNNIPNTRPVTLELWATVLERAFTRSNFVWRGSNLCWRDPTGLYDLLRHGPFLHQS